MAASLTDKEVSLKFTFTNEEEKTEYRTLSKINPEISNADLMTVGQELSDLQSRSLVSLKRIDSGTLANEPE